VWDLLNFVWIIRLLLNPRLPGMDRGIGRALVSCLLIPSGTVG